MIFCSSCLFYSIQILLKTISILVLALLLACNNNSNSKSTNNSPNVGDLALIKKDTCCDLKYPASQIGVKGDDLFNLNFTIVPTGTEPQDSFASNMALAQQNKSVKTGPSVPPLLPISPAAVDIFPH